MRELRPELGLVLQSDASFTSSWARVVFLDDLDGCDGSGSPWITDRCSAFHDGESTMANDGPKLVSSDDLVLRGLDARTAERAEVHGICANGAAWGVHAREKHGCRGRWKRGGLFGLDCLLIEISLGWWRRAEEGEEGTLLEGVLAGG